jgi:uncharacterized protein (TIGR03382 family)
MWVCSSRALVVGALLVVAYFSALPPEAMANGAYSHVHISQLAESRLPGGPLRAMLAGRRAEYESGSMFPDSGYAAGDDYGEIAHWEPFLSAIIAVLREIYCTGETCDFASAEAEARLAFVYGIASHGLADQFYDHTILKRSEELDGPLGDVDRLADYFIIRDPGVLLDVAPEGPFAELVAAFASPEVGYAVDAAVLESGMTVMATVIGLQIILAGTGYDEAWEAHPWLGTHIYDEATLGSLPDLADLVARYWLTIERRISGDADPDIDDDFILRTIPEDGAQGVALDRQEDGVCADLGIVLGFGVRTVDLAPALRLEDAEGAEHPITVRAAYSGSRGNHFRIQPDAPLAPDTVYDVVLDPGEGLETIDGGLRVAPFLYSFRTRAAGETSACDAYPAEVGEPLPPGQPPTDPDAGDESPTTRKGGCSAGGEGGTTSWIAVGLALLVARSRRRGIAR